MKNKMHILIPVLVLAVAFTAVTEASAGLFGRGDKQTREMPEKWRFQRSPDMNFASGTVSQDIYAGWDIQGTRLVLSKKCRIVGKDGDPGELSDGDQVVVMGPRAGNTIVAWQITILPANVRVGQAAAEERIAWSESDRTVGDGFGPN